MIRTWLAVFFLLVSLIFVGAYIYFSARSKPSDTAEDRLVRLVVFVMSTLASVWAIDVVIGYQTDLMTDKQAMQLSIQ